MTSLYSSKQRLISRQEGGYRYLMLIAGFLVQRMREKGTKSESLGASF